VATAPGHSDSIQYLSAAAAAGRPVLILATAFTLVQLLDAMAERRLSIPSAPGSRLMETGGYKNRSRALLKSELYASVDAHLGIPTTGVVMEYGMSELSSQAYDHVAGSDPLAVRTLRFPPWARAWVRDMDTGKPAARGTPGLLSIVDLANVASAIAILTEDLAVEHPGGIALLGRSAAAASKGCSLFSGDPNDAFAPLPLRPLTPLPDVAHAL
jgi:Acyl-protein synthetase, LuxE